jgi:tRNA threonylcarbamoyladenosine biosynthesis protein TsaB
VPINLKMAHILHIETTTTQCSVGLSKDGKIIALSEHNSEQYSHSEKLHVFIQECLQQASLSPSDLDAVAVSKGPGSYTGLRIGVSTAKGICFALDIPLISVSTLLSLSCQATVRSGVIIPLLDARRDEVYAAVYDQNHQEIRDIQAEIITNNSFLNYLNKDSVYIMGPGAEKCKLLIDAHPNLNFESTTSLPSAQQMVKIAHGKFERKEFENVAYFEPFYLKDFIGTPSKKTFIH